MATRAFFLLNVQSRNQVSATLQPVSELLALSWVKKVDEVAGVYDFLVEIETEGKISEAADILMSKPWVKRLHVLRVLPNENKPLLCRETDQGHDKRTVKDQRQ